MRDFIHRVMRRVRGEEPLSRLIKKGLVVGENFYRGRGVIIDSAHCWLIKIGDNVRLAPFVHILAHDAGPKRDLGYTRIGIVELGDNVMVGAHTIILPGVRIGSNVAIAAGSLVGRDIPDNSVAAGNPARRLGSYDDWLGNVKKDMETAPLFDEKWTLRGGITDDMKRQMVEQLQNGMGFVE